MRNSDDPRGSDSNKGERKFRRNLQSFDAAPSRSVVLRDLPFCCTSKDLQNFIAQYLGVPPSVAVVLRNPDGKTLQYGCALFEIEEHATQAMEKVHLQRLYGRDIRVLPYSSASLREVSRSGDVLISFITLSAMMESVTEQNLRNIVEGYGDIDYISIRHHKFSKEGIQNGFGFVTMTSQEENQRVLDNVKSLEVDNVLYTSEESKYIKRESTKSGDSEGVDSETAPQKPAASMSSPSGSDSKHTTTKLSHSSQKPSPHAAKSSPLQSEQPQQQSPPLKSVNNQIATTSKMVTATGQSQPPATSIHQHTHTSPQAANVHHASDHHTSALGAYPPPMVPYQSPHPYPSSANGSSSSHAYLSNAPPAQMISNAVSSDPNNAYHPQLPLPSPPSSFQQQQQLLQQQQLQQQFHQHQQQQYSAAYGSAIPVYTAGSSQATQSYHASGQVMSQQQYQPQQQLSAVSHVQYSPSINQHPTLQSATNQFHQPSINYQFPVPLDASNINHSPYFISSQYISNQSHANNASAQPLQLPQQQLQHLQLVHPSVPANNSNNTNSNSNSSNANQLPPPSYMPVSISPNGMNMHHASSAAMMNMPNGQRPQHQQQQQGAPPSYILASSLPQTPLPANYSYQVQYPNQAYASHLSMNQQNHHLNQPQQQQPPQQIQTTIYQQQQHQSSSFVSPPTNQQQPSQTSTSYYQPNHHQSHQQQHPHQNNPHQNNPHQSNAHQSHNQQNQQRR